ncbi:actinodin1 [Embiotoca jacksoni]|uniref:actinodin1 n=1 Tax=Embiotoca jacksoni TaxID=100190 RepID=UPI00370402A4
MLLPALLSAGPVVQKIKGDAGESIQERATTAAMHRRLIRNRRNISWYKQHSDFWGWYKYFTDNGNQEAVQEMDRIYLAYLQNKNRADGRRSYKAYLRHLGDIYKSCADTEDPNCVASYTDRPTPKPEPPKPAPIKTCNPTKDPYCLYIALVQGKSPYQPLVLPAATPAPAPVKSPAPLYVRSAASAKDPQSGYYYYAPSAVPFLSKEQKAELLRVCAPEDVECLQYHLRAAHGYTPSAGSAPSYAHLGCDPTKNPSCKPKLVQKAPSGLYLQYPNCDPLRDPRCAYAAAARAPSPAVSAGPGSCNPIFEEGCNPLTATRLATPPESYKNGEKDEAAAIRAAPSAAEQNNDPYAVFRDAYANANRVTDPYAMYRQASAQAPPPSASDPYAALRRFMSHAQVNDQYAPRAAAAAESNPNDPFSAIREAAAAVHRRGPPTPRQQFPFSQPSYEEPAQEERHPLGPPGKTKEGYDCFIGYDRECYPVKPSEPRSGVHRRVPYPAEAYEPHLNSDGTRNGVLEPPNPHCDPEYDRDCRLRRYEPEQGRADTQPEHRAEEDHSQGAAESEQHEREQYEAEPYQSGQEEPRTSYQPPSQQGMPSLQDILRHYGDQYPDQDDHGAYPDDYRKK